MNKIYLNELSLDGQFGNLEDFLEACLPLMKCLKFVKQNQGAVYKHSTFYRQKITQNMVWNDLRGVRNDKARRLKSLLLSTTDNPPFWDVQENLSQDLNAQYIMDGEDVTATSVAEAAEENAVLLSFLHEKYKNRTLCVRKDGAVLQNIESAVTLDYLSEKLWNKQQIGIREYLCARYEGTRLNFSKMEKKYGFEEFEKEELRDCLQTFEKFVASESWDEIVKDRGLYYKRYSPGSDDYDWFRKEEYQGKEIYKFRCGNPKRCFGYRERDVFYVLRMERDHKISDHG